jgi:hypothetical protein
MQNKGAAAGGLGALVRLFSRVFLATLELNSTLHILDLVAGVV